MRPHVTRELRLDKRERLGEGYTSASVKDLISASLLSEMDEEVWMTLRDPFAFGTFEFCCTLFLSLELEFPGRRGGGT